LIHVASSFLPVHGVLGVSCVSRRSPVGSGPIGSGVNLLAW